MKLSKVIICPNLGLYAPMCGPNIPFCSYLTLFIYIAPYLTLLTYIYPYLALFTFIWPYLPLIATHLQHIFKSNRTSTRWDNVTLI